MKPHRLPRDMHDLEWLCLPLGYPPCCQCQWTDFEPGAVRGLCWQISVASDGTAYTWCTSP